MLLGGPWRVTAQRWISLPPLEHDPDVRLPARGHNHRSGISSLGDAEDVAAKLVLVRVVAGLAHQSPGFPVSPNRACTLTMPKARAASSQLVAVAAAPENH
jgi:hypothetical protein